MLKSLYWILPMVWNTKRGCCSACSRVATALWCQIHTFVYKRDSESRTVFLLWRAREEKNLFICPIYLREFILSIKIYVIFIFKRKISLLKFSDKNTVISFYLSMKWNLHAFLEGGDSNLKVQKKSFSLFFYWPLYLIKISNRNSWNYINNILTSFWEIEDVENLKTCNCKELNYCNEYFEKTNFRKTDRRCVVEMSFMQEFFEIMLGNHKEIVSKRLDYL